MEGGNATGGGSCWSYREETGSDVSSTVCSSISGTIVSSAYTSSSSRNSTIMSVEEVAMRPMPMLSYLEIYGIEDDVPREDKVEEDIRSLVHEFFVGAPSAEHCGTNGGDMSVLERWFRELGVGWVLDLYLTDDGASAGIIKLTSADAQIWIRAFGKITKAISSSAPSMGLGLAIISEEGEEVESNSCNLDRFQFTLFVKETILKMVAFVDVIVHLDRNTITCENLMANGGRTLYQKTSIFLLVHKALSWALSQNKVSYLLLTTKMSKRSPAYTEIGRIWDEMLTLLYAKDLKACEVISSTLEQISSCVMELMEDMAATITPQGSFDIHKVTFSAMDHITFLLDNHSTLVSVMSQAESCFVSFDSSYFIRERSDTLDSIIMKMTSSLEEMLVSLSKSFSDQGLRFLFLLNNSYFMYEELQDYSHLEEFDFVLLICKVNEYMNSYLDVSWAPVLSCLLDPTPLCFHKNYSSLSKFESEFHKTYTTHKMWKVPNPKLRKKLRIAITEKIIPRYTRYIEDNNVRLTPTENSNANLGGSQCFFLSKIASNRTPKATMYFVHLRS